LQKLASIDDWSEIFGSHQNGCMYIALALLLVTGWPVFMLEDADTSHACVKSPLGYFDHHGLDAEKGYGKITEIPSEDFLPMVDHIEGGVGERALELAAPYAVALLERHFPGEASWALRSGSLE